MSAFVAGFTYNLMEQVFVERKPEPGAKFLANFGIECITSSIARHGNGVVKSAIDAAYKILSQVRSKFEPKYFVSCSYSDSFFHVFVS